MIRPIVRDVMFLQRKSVPASKEDIAVCIDLIDTLRSRQLTCAGMAANMIGVNKTILALYADRTILLMINPKITQKKGPFQAKEGCLSLDGEREAMRYHEITVTYWDMQFRRHTGKYKGFPAQVIQHEMDHFEGILI